MSDCNSDAEILTGNRAIAVLGFSDGVTASIGKVGITPQPAVIGNSISIAFEITNTDLRRDLMDSLNRNQASLLKDKEQN